jgi:hypothetical protein
MIDGAAAPAVPGAARDRDYAGSGDRAALMTADRQNEIAGAHPRRIAERCDTGTVGLEAQHGDIGAGVAPGERRLMDFAVGGHHLDAIVAFQRLLGGDDHAGAPVDAADRPAPAGSDGDHAATRAFGEIGEAIGKLAEEVGRIGHEALRWLHHLDMAAPRSPHHPPDGQGAWSESQPAQQLGTGAGKRRKVRRMKSATFFHLSSPSEGR